MAGNDKLYVLTGIGRRDDGEPYAVKFGPTSESPALLRRFDMRWPNAVIKVAVLPVLPGGLLRVSHKAVVRALGAAR